MSNLTRNGVAKNLSLSPYTFTEFIGDDKIIFYFSSKLHLNNFVKKRPQNFQMLYNHIYKRFKYKVDCRLLADCNLYTKIENRGYYIKLNDKELKCPDSITLNGECRMRKNCEGLLETLTIS